MGAAPEGGKCEPEHDHTICDLALQTSGQEEINGKTNLAERLRVFLRSCHEWHRIWKDNGTNETILEYFLEASLCVRPSKISGPASFRK